MPEPLLPLTPALDYAVIAELRGLRRPGRSDPLSEVIQIFLPETRERLSRLQGWIAGKDGPAIAQAAHMLCGSSANLGALRFAQLCRQLEQRANAGDWLGVAQTGPALETAWLELEELLAQSLKSP